MKELDEFGRADELTFWFGSAYPTYSFSVACRREIRRALISLEPVRDTVPVSSAMNCIYLEVSVSVLVKKYMRKMIYGNTT